MGATFRSPMRSAGRIVVGKSDDRLSWLGDGRVRVEVGEHLPRSIRIQADRPMPQDAAEGSPYRE